MASERWPSFSQRTPAFTDFNAIPCALVNRVDHADKVAPWTFGTAALMRNLAKRGLL